MHDQDKQFFWFLAEGPRFTAQVSKTMLSLKEYQQIEEGNGTPTLVIPGFSMSNASTFFFRRILNEKGHNTIKWDVPRNIGFNGEHIYKTHLQVKRISEEYGGPINIVGQSLGGCFARMVGNQSPTYVNVIVTLGSPITGVELIHPESIQKYNKMTGIMDAAIIHHTDHIHLFRPNPPVPSTSIYSRNDGVVNWTHSIVDENNISENIEIDSSHFSMGFNLTTIKIMANRLNQSKENWKKWVEI